MGRNAHFSSLHWYRSDHGLGEQSNRDKERRDRTFRRSFYAQESTKTEILVRTERQGIFPFKVLKSWDMIHKEFE